jgi:hypothetical protein
MLLAVRDAGGRIWFRADDRKRSEATEGMAHDPDALPVDVGTKCRILQHCIDDSRQLFRPPHPHANPRYIVPASWRVRRGGDDIATGGQCHRQVAVAQGEPAASMRNDDEPERSVGRWTIAGHLHLEHHPPTQYGGQPTCRERSRQEERSRCRAGRIPDSHRKPLPADGVLHVEPAVGDVPGGRGVRGECGAESHAENNDAHKVLESSRRPHTATPIFRQPSIRRNLICPARLLHHRPGPSRYRRLAVARTRRSAPGGEAPRSLPCSSCRSARSSAPPGALTTRASGGTVAATRR